MSENRKIDDDETSVLEMLAYYDVRGVSDVLDAPSEWLAAGAEKSGLTGLLARAGWLDPALAAGLKRMVGFRNIAVHDYQTLQLPITVAVITLHLDDFLRYTRALLLREGSAG